jgi:two-component system, response regulator PdtaR
MPTVLIVEDDPMIADLLEGGLEGCGYTICGQARASAPALTLAERCRPDFVIADVRLADGDLASDTAAAIRFHVRRGILYATGDEGAMAITPAMGDGVIAKPYRVRDVDLALRILGGGMVPCWPAGFRMLGT